MELLVYAMYIIVMALGAGWVVYRAVLFIRTQQEREQDLGDRLTKEELAGFLEEFKREREKQQRESPPS
jgi:hypothetical protein